jgi:protein-disulfide isomerase
MAKASRAKRPVQAPKQRTGRRPPPPRSGGAPVRSRKWLYLGALGVAAAVAVALILVSVLGGGTDKSTTPAQVDGTQTQQLFQGIPQEGTRLGAADAPVTLVVYEDPRCPFCQQWTLDALPTLVQDYVRPGKLQIEYRGIPLLGGASVRPLAYVEAAGRQNKLWNVSDLMYQHQGAENEAWATDDLLRAIGDAVPGFDTDKAMSEMDSQEVKAAITKAENQAVADGIRQTPSFFIGKTGAKLEPLEVSSLGPDQFTSKVDELLGQ